MTHRHLIFYHELINHPDEYNSQTTVFGAKDRINYSLEWGRSVGQRKATRIYTYTKPKDQLEKNHNKEALAILNTKKYQMILEGQSINTGHIPQHKFKSNFLDYYQDFLKKNSRQGNRHLVSSFNCFKKFVGVDHLSPIEAKENLCERYRPYLLDRLNGETPANYFSRFKRVLEAAKRDGYFKTRPAEGLAAKTKPNKRVKDILEASEYLHLMIQRSFYCIAIMQEV